MTQHGAQRKPPVEALASSPHTPQPPRSMLHLLYHELTAGPLAHTYQIQSDIFRSHLAALARVPQNNPVRPRLTFDDGHRSNYQLAFPLLEEFQTKATFFITAGWPEHNPAYMTWSELRALAAAGHTIAAHGWSHALLTHCDDRKLQHELVDAKKALEDNVGVSITSLSFPGGRFNASIVRAALQSGYITLYTSVAQAETLPLGTLVGRTNVRGSWSAEYLASLFAPNARALTRLRYQDKLKAAAKNVLGDRVYQKLWSAANGKQVEVDSFEDSRA